MGKIFRTSFLLALAIALIAMAGLILSADGQSRASSTRVAAPAQQPLFTDFKGVKLGVGPEEVRAKLGNPVVKDQEMDYFVLTEDVSVQVVYDAMHKVKVISVDYPAGTTPPDARVVVGSELENKPDGSAYKLVRYEAQKFWVSYNRSAAPASIVTITIQKIP
jgi:hypothetical protein